MNFPIPKKYWKTQNIGATKSLRAKKLKDEVFVLERICNLFPYKCLCRELSEIRLKSSLKFKIFGFFRKPKIFKTLTSVSVHPSKIKKIQL